MCPTCWLHAAACGPARPLPAAWTPWVCMGTRLWCNAGSGPCPARASQEGCAPLPSARLCTGDCKRSHHLRPSFLTSPHRLLHRCMQHRVALPSAAVFPVYPTPAPSAPPSPLPPMPARFASMPWLTDPPTSCPQLLIMPPPIGMASATHLWPHVQVTGTHHFHSANHSPVVCVYETPATDCRSMQQGVQCRYRYRQSATSCKRLSGSASTQARCRHHARLSVSRSAFECFEASSSHAAYRS